MRVAIITRRSGRRRPSRISARMMSLLRAWGCTVDLLLPDEGSLALSRVTSPHDLTLLLSPTPAALSLAGALHAQGARIVNPYPTAVACGDLVVATRILQLAGLPVPETWMTSRPARLASLLRTGSLVVRTGDGGRGHVVTTPAQLPSEAPLRPPYLVQRHNPPDGPEHRVYRVGEAVFWASAGVDGHRDRLSRPPAVSTELRDLVAAAGAAFGTDLFGLNIVISGGRPYIVDITAVPALTGVPEAGLRLAEYVYSAAKAATAAGQRP